MLANMRRSSTLTQMEGKARQALLQRQARQYNFLLPFVKLCFAGWYTAGGARFNATTMPSDSVKLIAKWNPMIVFDERGGKEVNDISDVAGSKVTLPETEKDGYIFAGWYTEQGNIYTSTSMPANSIKLVAKYHKILTKKL